MPHLIKTLIVDDEPIARQVLREELESLHEAEVVGEAENGLSALRGIEDLQPDLVFLDLHMPGMGGFEVIRRLSGPHLPVIVILTAFAQHAMDAFEAGAVDYLLKPVSPDRLRRALDRARQLMGKPRQIAASLEQMASTAESLDRRPPRKLIGHAGKDYFLLEPDQVVALQAEGELVWIVTQSRRFHASQSLRAMEANLHPEFQRVHRNAIVNLNHIRKLTGLTSNRWMLTLSNQQELVVSKRRAHYIRRLLQV